MKNQPVTQTVIITRLSSKKTFFKLTTVLIGKGLMINECVYPFRHRFDDLADLPEISEIRNNTMKTKNKIFAIDEAPAAIPPKPNTAAMIATTRNITVQRNIVLSFSD
jgi:hypothetical protein